MKPPTHASQSCHLLNPPFQGQGRASPQADRPCFAFNRGEFSSVRFATIYDVIDLVKHPPQVVYMAKVHSESAFRIIPISPAPDFHGHSDVGASFQVPEVVVSYLQK